MEGFKFQSYLTYTYKNSQDQMKDILQKDGYLDYKIIPEFNLIRYKINNERVIRLDNLLFLFKTYYLKITIAQLIQLCLQIVKKYQNLQQNSIKHNYLELNRILLKLDEKCQSMSILPQLLYYTIHFTGYDCPFYEKQDYQYNQIVDEDAIKSIILQILNCTYQNEIEEEKMLDNIKKLKNQIKISLDSFIQSVQTIFIEYSNRDNEYQILQKIDTQFNDKNYKRNSRKTNVQKNLSNLQNMYYNNDKNWFLYEQYLYQTIPLITHEFRKAYIYQEQKLQKDIKIFDFRQLLDEYDEKLILDLINQNIAHISESCKFEWDINIIYNDIKLILSEELQKLQYFKNDINFFKKEKNFIDQLNQFKQSIQKKVTYEAFETCLYLKYFQLIEELI
ncbi:unnamed protein product [Paramecium primaurelia]|uniref:Uncharacterized protein n=1 Tax=Paramecium primaurelia TaxID=5886 RepID=A0A8S1LFQ3_PARPR|nr:unnamed protein product [Paramecium primaurelia]